MTRERIGKHVGGGNEPEAERAERERKEAYREALSYWPSGVSVVAVREGAGAGGNEGAVHALTVSAFIPVSMDPPLVLTSLGGNASALPYLDVGSVYVISILGDDQAGLASRYADTFPVGPSPFPPEGPPFVRGSIASLVCRVDEMLVRGDHTLVIGEVVEASARAADRALAYFRRRYHPVG